MMDAKNNTNSPDRQKPKRFAGFLQGTFDHYSGAMPDKVPVPIRWLCSFLFSHVHLSDSDAKRIASLSRKGPIIYAVRNPSRLEYLLLWYLFRKKGLPAPKFSHYISMFMFRSVIQTVRRIFSRLMSLVERRIYPNPYKSGYVEELFKNNIASILPARHFVGLPWRFGKRKSDPLASIIEIRERLGCPVYILPIEFAYGRRPDRQFVKVTDLLWGTSVTPSNFRQVAMMLRNRKSTTIMVSDPMPLEQVVEEAKIHMADTPFAGQETAYDIRTRIIERINRERRVILGPVLKSKAEIIEEILHDDEMYSFLKDLTKEDKKDFVELRRDARKMLDEIAADYNPTTVRFMVQILTWVFGKLYSGMEIKLEQLDKVRILAREMPVVYIPCHKSHLDYLIVSYLLYKNNMSLPYIVSGVNLNFWPIGSIFRGGGAFFIRRSFKGKRLYSKVFYKYTEYLIKQGIPIEFFIEGTRSRTGKIVFPKLGFLSMLLEAVIKSGQKNLCIVPVSVNYEHIFEKNFYLNEAVGKKNEGENIGTMLRHRNMAKQKQGRMYLEIAEPFTLTDLLWEKRSRLPKGRQGSMDMAARLANKVSHAINTYSIATPFAIVSAVLLSQGIKGYRLAKIIRGAELLLGHLRVLNVRVVGIGEEWVQGVLDWMEKEKIISSEDDDDQEMDDDRFYFIDEDKRMSLTIYKNSIVHHYCFISILSVCFLAAGEARADEDLFEGFVYVKTLMAGELIYSDKYPQDAAFDREAFDLAMEFFTGHGFVRHGEGGGISLSKDGRRAARIFAGSILDFINSYYILAKTLWKNRKAQLQDKEWIKRAMKLGKRLHASGEVRRPEAVHKNIIESGLKHFKALETVEITENVDDKFRLTRTCRVLDYTKIQNLLEGLKPYMEL